MSHLTFDYIIEMTKPDQSKSFLPKILNNNNHNNCVAPNTNAGRLHSNKFSVAEIQFKTIVTHTHKNIVKALKREE